MRNHVPVWVPGCGRPHPDIELIKAWAEGKVTLIDKQRIAEDGKPHGAAFHVQYPCWNPDGWTFDVAKNSQMILDLGDRLVSTRKVKAPPRKDVAGQIRPRGNGANYRDRI